jgi:DNA cross-link repair 1A protein
MRASAGRFEAVTAFRPTGWCASRGGRAQQSGALRIHEVAYSEHSSFAELQQCVRDLQPERIVPTVRCKDVGLLRRPVAS